MYRLFYLFWSFTGKKYLNQNFVVVQLPLCQSCLLSCSPLLFFLAGRLSREFWVVERWLTIAAVIPMPQVDVLLTRGNPFRPRFQKPDSWRHHTSQCLCSVTSICSRLYVGNVWSQPHQLIRPWRLGCARGTQKISKVPFLSHGSFFAI
jgi:hypothetical protein